MQLMRQILAQLPYLDETKLTPYIPKANSEFVLRPQAISSLLSQQFPTEVLSQIFSYLEMPKDLANVSLVCKRFYKHLNFLRFGNHF